MTKLGHFFAFAGGFVVATLLLLGFNSIYGGVWLPLCLVGALAVLFYSFPRFADSRQTYPFLVSFGCTAVAIWMKLNSASPIRVIGPAVPFFPLAFLLAGAVAAVYTIKNLDSTQPSYRLQVLPAILFCLMGWVVVTFSGSNGGPDPMVHWLMTTFGLTDERAHLVTIAIRKTIHFTFYGSLALNACYLARPKLDLKKAAGFGLLTALTFAAYDELRQTTSPGRTGSAWDVGLDMLGGFCFVGLLVLLYQRRSQREGAASRPDL